MKVFITVALLCITAITYGQETSIRWNETQQLSWDDFMGKVNDSSKYDAECFAEIKYNYKFYSATDFVFDVFANFDKSSSWSRKQIQSADLLKHEQMHFNIAELFAEKLKKEFNSYNYTASYNTQIAEIFNQRKAEYHATQLKYDEETNHSLNKEKQKQWEDYITSELTKTRLSLQLAQTFKKDPQNAE